MHALLSRITLPVALFEVLPSLGASLLLAETFYRFGSFSLECLAFLGTWYLTGSVLHALRRNPPRRNR